MRFALMYRLLSISNELSNKITINTNYNPY